MYGGRKWESIAIYKCMAYKCMREPNWTFFCCSLQRAFTFHAGETMQPKVTLAFSLLLGLQVETSAFRECIQEYLRVEWQGAVSCRAKHTRVSLPKKPARRSRAIFFWFHARHRSCCTRSFNHDHAQILDTALAIYNQPRTTYVQ